MALLEKGILGPFTGKCGPVIGYIRNGLFCIRSMPAHYHDRRSQRQLENRSRLSLVMKAMSIVRPVISLTFSRFATDITEMNVATRENYYSLVKASDNGLRYNFPGLILSRGPVEPLTTLVHTLTGTTLSLLWNGQAIPGAGQDNVSVMLLNTQRMAMKFFHNVARREDGTATIPIPSTWKDEETYAYLLVERHGDWSNSCCMGTIPWNVESTPDNPSSSTLTVQSRNLPVAPSHSTLTDHSGNLPVATSHSALKNQQLTPAYNHTSHPDQSAVKVLFPSPHIRDHS